MVSREKIAWISREVLPHEPLVRSWLRRSGSRPADIDDLIQEAYCRIARADVAEVRSGRAYLFMVVRNLLLEQVRRRKIVNIGSLAEIEALSILDEDVAVDRAMIAREELALVQAMIDTLPPRCREVVRLRRIEGLSQRETAERLGLSENVVEKEIRRGVQAVVAYRAALAQTLLAPVPAGRQVQRDRRRD